MAGQGAAGRSPVPQEEQTVTIDTATTVGYFRVLIRRAYDQKHYLKEQIEEMQSKQSTANTAIASLQSMNDQLQHKIDAMRTDKTEKAIQLVDVKQMSQTAFSGTKSELFKP